MFNPFQMSTQVMQNQMMQKMRSQNPQLFNKVQEMIQGKNENELKEIAQNIAKERGIDLNQFANGLGLRI